VTWISPANDAGTNRATENGTKSYDGAWIVPGRDDNWSSLSLEISLDISILDGIKHLRGSGRCQYEFVHLLLNVNNVKSRH
jgi:hypothetical protein